jgi:hypothetical protein
LCYIWKIVTEKKHDGVNMIPNTSEEVCNGNCRNSHNPRKFACRNYKWRQCSSLSWISRTTVHFEFIPQGQTVNQAYCVKIQKRLHEAVRGKRPELWPNDWILHHDSAPAHKALSVKQFVAQKIDYWNGTRNLFQWFGSKCSLLFRKIKSSLKGRRFQDLKNTEKMWRRLPEVYYTTWVRKMFPTVATSLG